MITKIRFFALILLVAAALIPQLSKTVIPSQSSDIVVAQVKQ